MSASTTSPTTPTPGGPNGSRGKQPRGRIIAPPVSGQEMVLLAVVALLWLILWWATPAFMTAGSIRPLLIEVAPIALIGVGMTVVIISAGIDVSVGSAMMVCGVVTARLLVNELNTLPGFTATSVFPKLWEVSGLPFDQLCDRLLGFALERFRAERAGHAF